MAEAIPGQVYTGEVCKVGPSWGFIKCDDVSLGDMFLIPQTCQLWGRQLPPVGTRLKFTVVTDAKTGRPRADVVEPEDGAAEDALLNEMLEKSGEDAVNALLGENADSLEFANLLDSTSAEAGTRSSGVVSAIKPAFGFIKQDNGEADMFVLPPIPPVGTPVTFDIIVDAKTGRPRADNVLPVGGGGGGCGGCGAGGAAKGAWGQPPRPPPARQPAFMGGAPRPQCFGGKGCFGGPKGFGGGGFKGAPIGAGPFGGACGGGGGGARATGTVSAVKPGGTFGFIVQDSGEADMFILPPIPPVGTRVEYDVVTDPKTFRPRADNVQPLGGGFAGWGGQAAFGGKGTFGCAPAIGGKGPAGGCYGRAPLFGDGGHGFGGAKGGGGFQQRFSPYGAGGGMPGPSQRAAPAALPPPVPVSDGFLTGEVAKITLKYGFIKQDSGEADMFVFPPSCDAFGKQLPPVGTRVQYTVVIDQKTGRPRAEQVLPAP